MAVVRGTGPGREFVVVGSAGVYDCGGAHATGLDGAATYRIADGGLVDPGRWFVADAFAAGLVARVRSEHEKLRGEDCAAETSFDPARARPGPRGMVFAASVGRHASMTCRVDVVLPYATTRSYLSDEGRAAVADFEESR